RRYPTEMQPTATSVPTSTGKIVLRSLSKELDTDTFRRRLVDCCNETTIYDRLFRSRLSSNRYSFDDAAGFIRWADDGWRTGSHFVFVALDSDDLPIASCDIKTTTRVRDEIGYWRSRRRMGCMTDIADAMMRLAIADGFRELFARIHPSNPGSAAVVKRLGFERHGKKDDYILYRFLNPQVIG
ncbi:GNAT family N-acetyltransferase, partial [Rhodopirellula halodulae]|uniref:GNAT family N-acetyltransferase n=1 Tax=Rhodopirellula halodulae TaxID=2894198 RepID=UPI001E2E2844